MRSVMLVSQKQAGSALLRMRPLVAAGNCAEHRAWLPCPAPNVLTECVLWFLTGH